MSTRRTMPRTYRVVTTVPHEVGHVILLDHEVLRTPGKTVVALRPKALAEAVAEEWRGQGPEIALADLPLTRLVNTAIDQVAPRRAEVAARLAQLSGGEVLLHRVGEPAELAARQAAAADPVLAWAKQRYGLALPLAENLRAPEPSAEAQQALQRALEPFDAFGLTALASAASATHSLLLALALAEGEHDAEKAFAASRVDEDFQAERWGRDAAAEAAAQVILADLRTGARVLDLLRAE